MKEFRFVGVHADELEGGRPLAPGEYTGPINEKSPKNRNMVNDGLLIEVENGTSAKVDAINEAATAKMDDSGEHLTDKEWNAAAASVKVEKGAN